MSSAEHPVPEAPAPEPVPTVPEQAPAAEAAAAEPAAAAAEPVPKAAPEASGASSAELPAEALPEAVPAASSEGQREMSPAQVGAKLAELFPALFAGAPKPIKLRVHADIQQRAPGLFTKKSLSIFFHRHTTSTAYLKAMVGAAARVDLDGQPAGEIADEHRQAATAELERRRGIVEARRQAERDARRAEFKAQAKAEREQHKAARAQHQAQQAQHQAEQAQRDAEFEARRERAALLRAFETSTLTKTNFCALKGIPEAELDARLALAREERAARPPRPEHAERRPPQGDRRGPPRGDQRDGPRDGPRGDQRANHRGPRPPGPQGRGGRPRHEPR